MAHIGQEFRFQACSLFRPVQGVAQLVGLAALLSDVPDIGNEDPVAAFPPARAGE